MIKRNIAILFSIFVFFTLSTPLKAQIYQDGSSDYRSIPVYNKTLQFFLAKENNNSIIYIKQNLGFSDDPIAYVIPIKGKDTTVAVSSNFDPLNDLLDKYYLNASYGKKKVDYKIPPQIFNASKKDAFYTEIRNENIDLTEIYKNQIDNWFQDGLELLLIVINPVSESRTTWTKPLRIDTHEESVSLPLGWLKRDFGTLTTSKGKIMYAENFEGGQGGWQDDYEGLQANSLVTRDNNQASEGSYSLKVTNKPGSINLITTQTIGGLIPGEHYTFSAYVKNGTSTGGEATLRVMGSGLVALASGVRLNNEQSKNWQRISTTFQAKSAYHYFSLMAYGEPGEYIYWDAIQIEKGTESTPFQKDKVGIKRETQALDDLTNTSVDLQAYILSNKPYSAPLPTLNTIVYNFDDQQIREKLNAGKLQYLTQLQGTIQPDEASQFLIIDPTNSSAIKPINLQPRKEKSSSINNKGFVDFIQNNIILMTVLIIALLVKYVFDVYLSIKTSENNSLIKKFLYISAWLVNVLSFSFLITLICEEATNPYPHLLLSSSLQVFLAILFFTSLFIYAFTVFLSHKTGLKNIKTISELQVGITIVLILIAISWLATDLLTTKTSDIIILNNPNYGRSTLNLSKLPIVIFFIIEIVIQLLKIKTLKKEENNPKGTPSTALPPLQ